MSEHYVGIDVHKKWCVFTEINSTGKVVRQSRFGNNFGEVLDFASSLTPNVHVVVEPVLNYLWLLDHIEPQVGSVHVAAPQKVRVIAESKRKTDKYDSRMLAELLRVGFLPESWIPPREIRVLRGQIRQRYHLVKLRGMNKNRIRHLTFQHGVDLRTSDVDSPKARREIKKLVIPSVTGHAIEQCLQTISLLNEQIEDIERSIWRSVKGDPAVELLKTIPGVAKVRSAIIYAEIGDINRFHSAKALASYTGLIPTIRSSGGSVWTGGVTRLGSRPLRHALVEAAISASRRAPRLVRMYRRIEYRKNAQTARVAVAHKLAVIIYAMLRRNEPFHAEAA